MKKKCLSILIVLVLVIGFANPVFALYEVFTHPELGEMLTFHSGDGMFRFQIYGYTYYEIFDPQIPFRGMKVNQTHLIHDQMPLIDESLNFMFDSLEGKNGDSVPAQFFYTGISEPYSMALELLNREDKVEAIQLLNGFAGPEGYVRLQAIPGFEDEDFSALASDHETFTAKVGDKRYEYRVLQFFIDGNEVDGYYFERYCYLKIDGVWRLGRVTREYTDMSETRQYYHHGVAGSWTGVAYDVHYELMQELEWGTPREEITMIAGAIEEGNDVVIPETEIFRIPCSIAYSFTDGQLSGVKYNLNDELSFCSAFISLFMRYADPVTFDEFSNSSWSLNDSVIQLFYDEQSPGIIVTHDDNPS